MVACIPVGSQNLGAKSAHSEYREYPAFGDRASVPQTRRVEMAHDKGLIVELTVRCGAQVGIITFSKTERIYCTPSHKCWSDLDSAVLHTCEPTDR